MVHEDIKILEEVILNFLEKGELGIFNLGNLLAYGAD